MKWWLMTRALVRGACRSRRCSGQADRGVEAEIAELRRQGQNSRTRRSRRDGFSVHQARAEVVASQSGRKPAGSRGIRVDMALVADADERSGMSPAVRRLRC